MPDKLDELQNLLRQKNRHLDMMVNLATSATEAGDVGHLIRHCLKILASANECCFGQFWSPADDGQILQCSEWYYSILELPTLRNASLDRKFSKGVDLAGQAWATGLPVLLPTLNSTLNFTFTRRLAVEKENLVSAFAIPIKLGPKTIGVLELFSFHPQQLDSADSLFFEKLGVYLATLIRQREAAQAYSEQEIQNRVILNHSSNAFVLIDQAGVILDWTDGAKILFGWEKDEVVGKPIHDVIIPERYRDAHVKGLFRYMTKQEGPVINKLVRAPGLHRDGREIIIQMKIFPIEVRGHKRFGAFIFDGGNDQEKPAITLT